MESLLESRVTALMRSRNSLGGREGGRGGREGGGRGEGYNQQNGVRGLCTVDLFNPYTQGIKIKVQLTES